VKIDKLFSLPEELIKLKEYNELLEVIKQLDPREFSPTIRSAQHYFQKCKDLITAFRKNLAD
jgi:endonuclease III-like uncharacterized protein